MTFKKKLGLASISVVLGLLVGATVFGPAAAGAQSQTTTERGASDALDGQRRVDAFRSALDDLVADGTITASQADAVAQHLAEVLPHPGRGVGRHVLRVGLEEAAAVIGIERAALVDALRDGQSIAEVATANGVDPQTVIDALVALLNQRVDAAVAAGNLDEDRAAKIKEKAVERITGFVNGEYKFPPGDRPTAE